MKTQQTMTMPPRTPIERAAPRRSPGRPWYLVVAIVVAVLGVGGGLWWGFSAYASYRAEIDDMPRTDVPGEVAVNVTDEGEQVVYREGPGAGTIESLGLRVTGPDQGAVELSPYTMDLRYDAPDGTVGRAIARFDASVATYVVASDPPDGASGRIAVGSGVPASTIASIIGAVFAVGLALIAAVVLVIVGAVRKRR